ncbi:MAG: Hypothetical protein AJITA_00468 [Acetilactobacillus jinshanensis]
MNPGDEVIIPTPIFPLYIPNVFMHGPNKQYPIFCISDEIYSELTYGCRHYSFAMTGWRIGLVCGPNY